MNAVLTAMLLSWAGAFVAPALAVVVAIVVDAFRVR